MEQMIVKTTRFPLAGAEFTLYKDVNGDSKLQDDEKVNGIVKIVILRNCHLDNLEKENIYLLKRRFLMVMMKQL